MSTIELHSLTFAVEKEHDHDAGTPWDREDGHGPVSGWRHKRTKRPGELVLNQHSPMEVRFYDFAEACKIALRDGWGSRYAEPGMSKRQIAALAAREDYEHLKAWCRDGWGYIGVIVTLLDADGNKTDYSDELWGVADDGSHADTMACDLALSIGALVNWGPTIELPARTVELRRAA
ncbi:hypothetical protein QT562_22025 [Xanthomonas citri pv. citri]|nr:MULTISPECIES: hypothetical protein [Xanthomonas]AGH76586.1 hypothetical protein XAC29_05345 [Xanthomonas axonopodis Xac29-1]AJD67644.1 hypothetical protein J151_01186 [Xanthomonas citri subsp. citri A306]AJY81178.1 hypothetical protein J159_01183 [Xanthomonas citri pv. citri]AJY85600.1 hypothetical protein J158_01183 [Xanthomonas citri subsp. citri UI6]AJY90023.1 hypothetical protein J169_01182 [Xanthomonas citri pv. citri]